ncbi:MAG TPA: M23 family metallopeptidase [Dermatophilaceae bacterium]|nr:M23 family metallopeptidase [Dermatophilaceae bacterium]
MSSRSYAGRHHGKHRAPQSSHLPRALRPGFVLPTTAAAAVLLVSATGAAGAPMAQPAPLALELSTAQAATVRDQAAEQAAERSDLTVRRQQVAIQTAARQGRVEQQQRVARTKAREAAETKRKAAEAKRKAAAAAAKRARAEREGKRWTMPLAATRFTSGFGMRWGRLHAGNDFGCSVGTPVRAMSKGTVIFAGSQSGYGTKVEIRYWDGTVSYFGHLSVLKVSVGDTVLAGDVVALSGNTGRSTGPHLHLEIHPNGGGPINPRPWLAAKGLA